MQPHVLDFCYNQPNMNINMCIRLESTHQRDEFKKSAKRKGWNGAGELIRAMADQKELIPVKEFKS